MKTLLPVCLLATISFCCAALGSLEVATPSRGQSKNAAALLPGASAAKIPTSRSTASTILHDGKNWTIVPKTSVLHLPACYLSQVDSRPVGNLLSWNDFLETNSAWLASGEVTFEQAAGTEAITPARLEELGKWSKIVIATHRGKPIPVILPP